MKGDLLTPEAFLCEFVEALRALLQQDSAIAGLVQENSSLRTHVRERNGQPSSRDEMIQGMAQAIFVQSAGMLMDTYPMEYGSKLQALRKNAWRAARAFYRGDVDAEETD